MDAVPTDPLARFVYRQPPSSIQNQPEFLFIVDSTHLIPRCESTTLRQLLNPELAPFPLKEQSGFFYTAQCAHYGLPERKTKDVAKKTLATAFDQQGGTLRVPVHILAREKEVKKEYEKEIKKAEAAAKKAEAEEKKRADKIEEMSRVRQKALADLAKVNAFEKKLIGTAAGSSRPKAAAAAFAPKKTTASATKKNTTTSTTTSATATKRSAAPAKKVPKVTTSNLQTSAGSVPPEIHGFNPNTYFPPPSTADRQPRPYSSTEIPLDYIPQPRAPVPRPKQTARRSRPMSSTTATVASSSTGRVKAEPGATARARPVKKERPDVKPKVKQETKPVISHDHYEQYETHIKPEMYEHESYGYGGWDMHDELDEDYGYHC